MHLGPGRNAVVRGSSTQQILTKEQFRDFATQVGLLPEPRKHSSARGWCDGAGFEAMPKFEQGNASPTVPGSCDGPLLFWRHAGSVARYQPQGKTKRIGSASRVV